MPDSVILARHGESEFSVRGAMSGDPAVAIKLTEAGVEQARRLGRVLRDEPIDLCVTSEFPRVIETADVALAGREVPRLILAELNDPRVGEFEGRLLSEYRAWAGSHGPEEVVPGGGESRAEVVRRYVRGFRAVLARPERHVLVVAHSLPIRYVVNAAKAEDPGPIVELVPYAQPYRLSREDLARAVSQLDAWSSSPTWKVRT